MRVKFLHMLSPSWRGALFYALFWGATGAITPFLNVHYSRLGLTGQQIGLLSTTITLVSLVYVPFLSALADRRQQRTRVLAGTLVGLSIAVLLLGLSRTPTGVIPLAMLVMLFQAPVAPIADSLIAHMSANHALNYGNVRLWGSLSAALVAALCGMLWERLGFGPMFATTAALMFPVALFALSLDEVKAGGNQDRASLRQVLGDTGMIALLIATFFIGIGMQSVFVFGGVYMSDLGGSESMVGLLFSLSVVCELPGMQYSTAAVHRMGGVRTLLLAYSLFGIGFLGYALAWTPAALLLSSLFTGLGFGLFAVTTVRVINDRVPPEWSSTAQSLTSAVSFGLASLLNGTLGGRVYDVWGPPTLYAISVLVVILAITVLALANARGLFEEHRDLKEETTA